MSRVAIECMLCSKTFWVYPCRASKTIFCSRKCRGKWQSENWKGVNNPFYGKKHTERARKIISQKNMGNHHTQEAKQRISDKMKERFKTYRHPSKGKHLTEKTRKKISDALKKWRRSHPWTGEYNPRWKGGYEPYYGSNWPKQKMKTRKRDNYTCQICGMGENVRALDVHHIIMFREFGRERYKEANQSSNLITLCRSCHIRADRGEIQIDVLKGAIERKNPPPYLFKLEESIFRVN